MAFPVVPLSGKPNLASRSLYLGRVSGIFLATWKILYFTQVDFESFRALEFLKGSREVAGHSRDLYFLSFPSCLRSSGCFSYFLQNFLLN